MDGQTTGRQINKRCNDIEMKELLASYLASPTLDKFMSLRDAVMGSDGFNPYSSEMDDNQQLLDSDEHEKILGFVSENLWPNHLLSPRAHLHMAHACIKLGKEDQAELEGLMYERLLQGIELTGTGTKEEPFLVTRTSDEYDYLREHRLTLNSQGLIEIDDREFDVMSTKEQGDIWFDITDIKYLLKKMLDNTNNAL